MFLFQQNNLKEVKQWSLEKAAFIGLFFWDAVATMLYVYINVRICL